MHRARSGRLRSRADLLDTLEVAMRTRLRHRLLPRILWTCAIAAVVAIVGALALHGSGGTRHAATVRRPVAPTTATHARRRMVPLRPAVSNVVLKFVKTAVMRSRASRASLLEGWRLTGPKLKQGTTLREWLAGTSSVVPFPDGAIAPPARRMRCSSSRSIRRARRPSAQASS
jgi:hypothetical protein